MENVPSHPIPDDFMTNTENRLCALRFNEKTNELFPRGFQVRGAPLIAVVGALGLLVEISDLEFKSPDEFMEFVESKGMRLTATELRHSNVPFKIITDSMAAWTMKKHKVDAVLVGADQVALNGDTANKIGTYMLAVLAKHHHVPFYPVVPITTLNLERQSGDDIPIEERPAAEMLYVNGRRVSIGAKDTPVWNPAFDVTPADLITKIITDRGCFSPKDMKKKL
ncbi:initiation factor, subunit 2 family protein [Ancylostoma duodenale]|uniref:Initiation factor, subunit 2 family protein n=1 Tax=Ancylostoma duodenale TaxID=51022 RepID=A0A0C2HAF9_9BILA|nr:initiation factor, subunit 2 family protein [Ancylostoma duodenale]